MLREMSHHTAKVCGHSSLQRTIVMYCNNFDFCCWCIGIRYVIIRYVVEARKTIQHISRKNRNGLQQNVQIQRVRYYFL